MALVAGGNQEAVEAWNGVLFDRYLQFRHIVTTGLGAHGDEAMRLYPPPVGGSVLDIGCGFGDTTQQLAELIGPSGTALGVDPAERFIEVSNAETTAIDNVSFEVADVEATKLDQQFDYAFSRMGTMFFANPVAALRNVNATLKPGGLLVMVVWRRKLDNDWMYRGQQITEKFLTKPEEYDEPTCGPGPFSMADADTTSHIMLNAHFTDVSLHRCDLPIMIGDDVDEAVELMKALGPAGEILRLNGDRATPLLPEITAALREGLSEYARPDGQIEAPASTWIVSGRAPVN